MRKAGNYRIREGEKREGEVGEGKGNRRKEDIVVYDKQVEMESDR